MAGALCRVACVYAGALAVSGLYAVFISRLGESFAAASNAFWVMSLLSFLTGLAASIRFPVSRRPRWPPLLASLALVGLALLRSSPEGFLLFGVTPLANSWAPPLLAAAGGALAGSELSRPG